MEVWERERRVKIFYESKIRTRTATDLVVEEVAEPTDEELATWF